MVSHDYSTPDSDPNPGYPARISFSTDFLHLDNEDDDDDTNDDFISICPANYTPVEFEFLTPTEMMTTAAEELFRDGKLLPLQLHKIKTTHNSNNKNSDDHNNNKKKTTITDEGGKELGRSSRMKGWFVDEDPSPRPPKCTLLWKDLLMIRRKKQQATQPAPAEEENKKVVTKKGGGVRLPPLLMYHHVAAMQRQGRAQNAPGNNSNLLPPLFSLRRSSSPLPSKLPQPPTNPT